MSKQQSDARPWQKDADDSDLADLLGSQATASSSNGSGIEKDQASRNGVKKAMSSNATSKIQLSSDAMAVTSLPSSSKPASLSFSNLFLAPFFNFVNYCSNCISVLCYYYPRTCECIALVAIVSILLAFFNWILNPTQTFGDANIPDEEYLANIKSKYDLSLGKIDHWCLSGGNSGCTCEDPLTPLSKFDRKSWAVAFEENQKVVNEIANKERLQIEEGEAEHTPALDIAFIGADVVEEMDGRWMGQVRSDSLKSIRAVFDDHFNRPFEEEKKHNGPTAVALGIAGDQAPHVLYRLLRGEMPRGFNPQIWWIMVGNSELARAQCSEEVVVLGVLRLVEEILDKKPDAHVVINSLLPMLETRRHRSGPLITDYQDSFKATVDKRHHKVDRLQSFKELRQKLIEEGKIKPRANPVGGNNRRRSRFLLLGRNRDRVDDKDLLPNLSPAQRDAELEELKRIKRERLRERFKAFHNRRERTNPLLLDKERQKKYDAKRAFMRRNSIPLWTSIQAVNRALQKFANKHSEQVTFVNVSPHFLTQSRKGKRLNSALLSSRGHPTLRGFHVLDDAIVDTAQSILAKLNEKRQKELGLEDDDDLIASHKDYMDPVQQGFDDGLYSDDEGATDYSTVYGERERDRDEGKEVPSPPIGGDPSRTAKPPVLGGFNNNNNNNNNAEEGNTKLGGVSPWKGYGGGNKPLVPTNPTTPGAGTPKEEPNENEDSEEEEQGDEKEDENGKSGDADNGQTEDAEDEPAAEDEKAAAAGEATAGGASGEKEEDAEEDAENDG